MKILIISNKIPYPPKDGGSIATFNIAFGLSELGCDVTILTINTSKHYFNINEIPFEIRNKIKFIDFYLDTKIRVFGLIKNLFLSELPYNAERFVSKEFGNLIIKTLKNNNFDIVQLEGLYLTPYISLIRENTNAKISLRAHNVEHEIWERTKNQEKNRIKKIYINTLKNRIKKMENGILNKFDFLIPITERDAIKFNKFGNLKPFFVSPTGYILKDIKTPDFKNVEFPSIFFIGALDWSPNQEGLIWFLDNCWTAISKNIPGLKFYIAGRNAPQWLVKKILENNIIYCGEVDNAAEFINSKALMLVPLLSGSGMRIKIIEGMALGKTIISTSIGTEGIDTSNNKNILIADSIQNFIKIITEIFKDKNVFFEIGKNANTFIFENFDNFAVCKKLLNFYEDKLKN